MVTFSQKYEHFLQKKTGEGYGEDRGSMQGDPEIHYEDINMTRDRVREAIAGREDQVLTITENMIPSTYGRHVEIIVWLK